MSASERIPVRGWIMDPKAIPTRIDRDNPHGERRAKQANPAIGLREQRRGIDEGQFNAVALRNLLGENGGSGRELQPWPEGRTGAAADRDDHVAIAAIRRRRIAGDVQADLPQGFGTNEVCTLGNSSMSGVSTVKFLGEAAYLLLKAAQNSGRRQLRSAHRTVHPAISSVGRLSLGRLSHFAGHFLGYRPPGDLFDESLDLHRRHRVHVGAKGGELVLDLVSLSTFVRSALTLSTIASGVPTGASSTFQPPAMKPGNVSAAVARSLNSASLSSDVTAMPLMLPPCKPPASPE